MFTEICRIMWFFAGTLIWYHTYKHTHTHTHTHIQRHIEHVGASRLTHPYKYIFTPLGIFSQQLSLLHWIDNSLISKNHFPRCLFFSRIIHLQSSYISWLDAIIPWCPPWCNPPFQIFLPPPPHSKVPPPWKKNYPCVILKHAIIKYITYTIHYVQAI